MAIELTERAGQEVQAIFAQRQLPADTCLRVAIRGGGCAGFSYVMDLADSPAPDDEVFTSQGVRVVCDPKSYLYLNGTVIDFADELMGRHFVFNNPLASTTCRCGASFSG